LRDGASGMSLSPNSFQFFRHAHFAFDFAAIQFRADVFWLYLACAVLSAIGVTKIFRGELAQRRGPDKFLPFGRLFYAIPMGVFGVFHFVNAAQVATLIPKWMPWHMFWTYFVGIALIAASLSIILQTNAWLAGALLGCMFLLFVAMMDIHGVIASHGSRFSWALALRQTAFGGGAFAVAAAQLKKINSAFNTRWLVAACRFFVGIPAVVYGAEHFLHPTFAPGVPLPKITPTWIPGHLFWAYFMGAMLIICGLCIVVNFKARFAALYLGIAILLIVVVIYLPITIAKPSDIAAGLLYVLDTLAFCGTVFALADAIAERA
jgi:uncharacterized membrane protein